MGFLPILAKDGRHPLLWLVGLIRHLDFVLKGHTFTISTIVLSLDAPSAYLIMLGWSWLRTANIKQNWQGNIIYFHRGKTKIYVPIEEHILTTKDTTRSM